MKRREFFERSLLIGAGFTFLPVFRLWSSESDGSPSSSRVIEITHAHLRTGSGIDASRLERLLDEGLCHLYHIENLNKSGISCFRKMKWWESR